MPSVARSGPRIPRCRSSSSTTARPTAGRRPSPPSSRASAWSASAENRGFAGGVNAGRRRRARGRRGARPAAQQRRDGGEPGFLEPLVDAASPPAGRRRVRADPRRDDRTHLVRGRRVTTRVGATRAGTRDTAGEPLPPTVAPYDDRPRLRRRDARSPRSRSRRSATLDESLFAYAEDVDWSLRARAAGLADPRRPGERRPPSRVRVVGRRVVARLALLRPAKRPRRRGAMSAASAGSAPGGGGRRPRRRSPRRRFAPGAASTGCARSARASRRASRPARARGADGGPPARRPRALAPAPPPTTGRPAARRPRHLRRLRRRGPAGAERAGCSRGTSGRRYGATGSPTARACFCEHCGCSLRVRRIAERRWSSLYGTAAATLAELVREDAFRALRIAEINSIGRMHPFLARGARSRPCRVPGGGHPGAQLEPTGRFDLVLTSETLEHVPDPRLRAAGDAPRAAARAGATSSPSPSTPRSRRAGRATGCRPSTTAAAAAPSRSSRGKADMLVHTDFGRDLADVVRAEGFDVATDGEGIELVVDRDRGRDRREPSARSSPASAARTARCSRACSSTTATRWPGSSGASPDAYAESLGELRAAIELVAGRPARPRVARRGAARDPARRRSTTSRRRRSSRARGTSRS